MSPQFSAQLIVLEIRGQCLERRTFAALCRSGIPIIVLGGAIECNDPIVKELRWAAIMQRTSCPRASLPNQIQSDSAAPMKTLSVTDVARNFRAVLDRVEHQQEEIVLVSNRRQVARLVPEASHQTALEVFGDLYRTLDDRMAAALAAHVKKAGTIGGLQSR